MKLTILSDIIILVVLIVFFVRLYLVALDFIHFQPEAPLSPEELTKMVFLLLGLNIMVFSLFFINPILSVVYGLIKEIKKSRRKILWK